MAGLLVLALVALALVPDGARAETGPQWDESNQIVLTPGAIEAIGSYKCSRWPDGSPQKLSLLNNEYEIYGICLSRTATAASYRLHFGPEESAVVNASWLRSLRWETSSGETIVADTHQCTHLRACNNYVSLYGSAAASTDLSPTATLAASITHPNSSNVPLCAEKNYSSYDQTFSRTRNYRNYGFSCMSEAGFNGLLSGESTTLTLTAYPEDFGTSANVSADDDPPQNLEIDRSDSGTSATLEWSFQDKYPRQYQIERQRAVVVGSGSLSRIEYGEDVNFFVDASIAGLDNYVDDTVRPQFSYQYRVRARGVSLTAWGDWSSYTLSGGLEETHVNPPTNLRLSREHDNSEVTISWTAPIGDFDSYTLQRQELVIVESSTIFANAVTLDGNNWLPGSTTTFTDSSILPGNTYEYRVAAVKADGVGEYTDWTRSSPVQTSLGDAPQNFRFLDDSTHRHLADRREFWMTWDPMDGADEYEVGVLEHHLGIDRQSSDHLIVSDPTVFRTAFGRVELRVRGRKHDTVLCGPGADDYCYTAWTPWYEVQFYPKLRQKGVPTPIPDASIDEFQADVNELLDSTLDQSGVDVDPSIAVQFAVLVGSAVLATASVVAGWKRGMRPLGVGMGFSVLIISLYLAYRLLGIPAAWPIGAQTLVAIPGVVAFARQIGAFR